MKPVHYLLLALLFVLISGGAFAWYQHENPLPTVSFVEFRTDKNGRSTAIFRASNISGRSFSYWGPAKDEPFYLYRIPSQSGGEIHRGILCFKSQDLYELAPHPSIEFAADVPRGVRSTLGVQLWRGTPTEVRHPRGLARMREHFVGTLPEAIRQIIGNVEPTWSSPIP